MGWVYDAKKDFSAYRYMVINTHYNVSSATNVNFYIAKNIKGAICSVPLTLNAKQTVIDLSTLKYTSGNNIGKALNLKSINMVTFTTGAASKSLYVTDMYLTNDDPTGINEVEWQQQQRQTVNVYTLSGRMVRQGVSSKEGLQGLPAGIYLMNGKKMLVK